LIVVSDTSTITNLAAIERLPLLAQLYTQVIIPNAVYRELVDLEFPVPGTIEVQSASWLQVRQVVQNRVVEQLQNEARLDLGESEALALALELGAELLLIDERRGRAEATRLGLRITGLLGVLIEAKHKNLLAAVKPLMDALIATSEFRVSPVLYNQILEMVDEV
jgi:predicted nucleic acid-binding protein